LSVTWSIDFTGNCCVIVRWLLKSPSICHQYYYLSTLEFQIDHTVGKNLHGWKNSRSIWQTINFLWRLARYQWPLCQDTFLWRYPHYLYRFSSRVNFSPPCGLFGTREYLSWQKLIWNFGKQLNIFGFTIVSTDPCLCRN